MRTVATVLKFILLVCSLTLCWEGIPQAADMEFPFSPGEKLTYQVRWGFIPAGKAVLEVYPPEIINGEKAHHFVLVTKTNPFVDVFYKVRQRIDAYTDIGMNQTIFYKEKSKTYS